MTAQAGNVLFLILIAVALFAALSYAVTNSTRSGGGNADKEKLTTDSAALIQHATAIHSAVTRMRVSNGISANELFFDPPSNFGSMTPTQLSRQVFHPTGGGAVYQSGWWFGSCDGIRNVGTSGSGANSMLDIIAYRTITRQQCLVINERLGIGTLVAGYTTYQYSPQQTVAFPGICNNGSGTDVNLANIVGKEQGCYQDND